MALVGVDDRFGIFGISHELYRFISHFGAGNYVELAAVSVFGTVACHSYRSCEVVERRSRLVFEMRAPNTLTARACACGIARLDNKVVNYLVEGQVVIISRLCQREKVFHSFRCILGIQNDRECAFARFDLHNGVPGRRFLKLQKSLVVCSFRCLFAACRHAENEDQDKYYGKWFFKQFHTIPPNRIFAP